MTNKQMPGAVEGAFVVLLGQNALLFSRPIKNIVEGGTISAVHIVICAIALVSFFNVAANWVSSLEIDHDPVDYKSSHLFWDIAILGILFTTTQTLIELCGDKFEITLLSAVNVTASFYIVLGVMYVIWNNIEIGERRKRDIGETKDKIHVLQIANTTNILNIMIGLFMLILPLFTESIRALYMAFALWVALWIYIMIIFINNNSLFKSAQ